MGKDKALKSLSVLFAPAHYLLDEEAGSEYGCAYNIVQHLSENPSVRPHVICGASNVRGFAGNVTVYPQFESGVLLEPAAKLKFVYQVFREAKRIQESTKIDIVHHMYPFGYRQTFSLLMLLGGARDAPLVIGPIQEPLTPRDVEFMYSVDDDARKQLVSLSRRRILLQRGLELLTSPVLNLLSRKTLEKADIVICASNAAKELYSRYVEAERIRVIWPGVDIDAFEYVERCDAETIEVLSVSNLIQRKRIDLIVEAVARIIKRGEALRLRILGKGPELDNLVSLVDRLGVKDHVFFEGFVPNSELASYYQRADVFCTMSLSEAFGMTTAEAMATGLPVISFVNNGSRELVDDGVSGFLLPPGGEVDALEQKLQLLMDDHGLRIEMGKHGRRMVEQEFNWDVVADRLMAIYLKLVG